MKCIPRIESIIYVQIRLFEKCVRTRELTFRNFLSRSIVVRRGGTSLFSYGLSSSVSFSRCDDNDSAESEQSSSIRLLMRVIIEPGSPVLIMRFRICRSENEHPRRADTASSLCSGEYACVRLCVRPYVRACVYTPTRASTTRERTLR